MKHVLAAIFTVVVVLATAAQAQDRSRVYLPQLAHPSGPTAVPPSPTPLDQVYVVDSRAFVDAESGIQFVVGEVVNSTATTVYATRVRIWLEDAGGQLLESDTVYTLISQLAPGERTGFLWAHYDPPAGVARAQARVSGWERDGGLDYRPITVVSAHATVDDGVQVAGEIRNDQGVPLHDPKISITFYDAAGRVIDVAETIQGEPLQPGATSSFTISTYRTTAYSSMAIDAESYVEQ